MHCVLGAVGSEQRTDGMRCLLFGVKCVDGPNSLSPPLNCVFCDQFNASDNIACYEVHKSVEKWLALMLSVELPGALGSEPCHLELAYHETTLVDCIDDLSGAVIGIWFDHCESALSL